ncbi:MAG: hypothetical protein ACKVVP_07060 [Chloroflexota bacterium]
MIFLLALLAPRQFDPSALVNAGDRLVDAAAAPPSLTVIRPGDGYDGQFSYRLALDPFTTERSAEGLTLDIPAYRQQRILHPLLAWAVSLGRSTPVPLVLALLNIAAIVALSWLCAHYAQGFGKHPLWGLGLALLPSTAIALANDLPEILLAACLVAAALALERRRIIWATLALMLGVLTHEHALVLVLAVALVTLSAPELRLRGWQVMWCLPLAVFVAWQVYLTHVWGDTPLRVAMEFLNQPFRGLVSIGRHMLPAQNVSTVIHLSGFAVAAAFTLACAGALSVTRAHRAVCLGWVFSTIVLFLGTGVVWETELAFWRASTASMTLGTLMLIGSELRLRWAVIPVSAAFGVVFVARLTWLAWL